MNEARQSAGAAGFCAITGREGPIPRSHSLKLTGVPGGSPMGVSIVSFDKAAFESYGLDGAANAGIGYEAADGYARAFQWLRGSKSHHLTVGNTLFLFWTRLPTPANDMMALSEPTADQVRALLANLRKGKTGDAIDDTNAFFLLAVSGNAARDESALRRASAGRCQASHRTLV